MKFGLISDSHDHLANVKKSIAIFKERGVEMVIHAGDFVAPPVIKLFDGCGMQLAGVFGNNDGEKLGLAGFFEQVGGKLYGDFADFVADECRFGVYHGTSLPLLESVVTCGTYDVVVTGHTHKSAMREVGKTLLLNPGSAHGLGDTATIMILQTPDRNTELIEL